MLYVKKLYNERTSLVRAKDGAERTEAVSVDADEMATVGVVGVVRGLVVVGSEPENVSVAGAALLEDTTRDGLPIDRLGPNRARTETAGNVLQCLGLERRR